MASGSLPSRIKHTPDDDIMIPFFCNPSATADLRVSGSGARVPDRQFDHRALDMPGHQGCLGTRVQDWLEAARIHLRLRAANEMGTRFIASLPNDLAAPLPHPALVTP